MTSTMTNKNSSTVDTNPVTVPEPYGPDQQLDPFMFLMLVSVNAQNEDQMCMQTLSETLKFASEAGTDCSDAGTSILDKDNQAVQNASKESDKDKASIDTQAAQSTMQYDNTRINNATQQWTTYQQSLETEQNQLSKADENETTFMNSVMDIWTNLVRILG